MDDSSRGVQDVGGTWSAREIVSVPGLLDRLVALTGTRMRTTSSGVRVAQLLDRHARVIAEAAAPHVVAGRRPSLVPEGVLLHVLADGHLESADVPASAETGAPVDLATRLGVDMVALHEPIVAALAALRGRAASVLWRSVGDRAAIALSGAARAGGLASEAGALIAAVIASDPRLGKPRRTGVAVVEGGQRPFLVRAGCCLSYRTVKGESCFTCPLVDDDERRARHAADLAREAAQPPA